LTILKKLVVNLMILNLIGDSDFMLIMVNKSTDILSFQDIFHFGKKWLKSSKNVQKLEIELIRLLEDLLKPLEKLMISKLEITLMI
jgi:hypothetical protein